MNNNTSLSAKIRRRNAQGFEGVGNHHFVKQIFYGNYLDKEQNHKDVDYRNNESHKTRVGYIEREIKQDAKGNLMYIGRKTRCMSKKFANNKQKVKH